MIPVVIPDRTVFWPYNWPRDLRLLSDGIKEEAAIVIARKLLKAAHGPIDDPATWEHVAVERSIGLLPYADILAEPGYYLPPSEPEGPAVIAINHALCRETQTAAWIHELAHDELDRWMPPQLTDASDACCYEGDVEEERQDMAERVEVLVRALHCG